MILHCLMRRVAAGLFCATMLFLMTLPVVTISPAAGVAINGVAGRFSVPVTSRAERRWMRVHRQRYDYSCGSAAVATLLEFHYGIPTSESEVFETMYANADRARVQKEGFSMLDLKRFLDSKGLESDGFRLTLEQWAKVGIPGIALIEVQGYRHFVVVKGLRDDRVLLADPAAGTRVLSRQRFVHQWNGIVLAARARADDGRESFDSAEEWDAWPVAPIGRVTTGAGLGTYLLSLPGLREFGS